MRSRCGSGRYQGVGDRFFEFVADIGGGFAVFADGCGEVDGCGGELCGTAVQCGEVSEEGFEALLVLDVVEDVAVCGDSGGGAGDGGVFGEGLSGGCGFGELVLVAVG